MAFNILAGRILPVMHDITGKSFGLEGDTTAITVFDRRSILTDLTAASPGELQEESYASDALTTTLGSL